MTTKPIGFLTKHGVESLKKKCDTAIAAVSHKAWKIPVYVDTTEETTRRLVLRLCELNDRFYEEGLTGADEAEEAEIRAELKVRMSK